MHVLFLYMCEFQAVGVVELEWSLTFSSVGH